ncbi:hypothetical protein ASPWEDRAFT_47948 [Aspergillus wentii DTO 134E9]|uniref:Mannosyltransferase n=1 Tax=Aspergillus wentii DTO 134E9 TaxID=1073089 RepID=A0A1L9S2G9_ASPWE|nr:uncharacterized protein ASPWEDRAFT_47948 [Aspergillus wentii DTO 134E9]KAI9924399.1 alpha 1,2 mannosyltransferase [Aspergillus wentii]OJJ41355.1 hypothetical protein ASPWEDRAFT_47948 [Aspergillus wentii DTO 134E9]
MWRRTYLLLLLIRVYFALSPSYLHPDENFQGPEVVAGRIFSFPSKLPWEFTVDNPIRSAFPLWPVYDVPMSLLKWFYTELGTGHPPPDVIFYFLRGVMFLLSFVLEDWAIYELVPSPRQRRATVVLVASSYVTWTYQTHTFSNSLETLLVAWGLVLIRRIVENKRRSSFFSCAVLSFIAVAGVFNRITFPAFLIIPGLQLLPHFRRKPIALVSFIGFGLFFTSVAILVDTAFYRPSISIRNALRAPVITPLNNLFYNSNSSNLALHGLHPHYQHFIANLFQLLGPAYVMMIWSLFSRPIIPPWLRNMRAASAISATAILSIFPHQEPRFLIPCVPLLLSCFKMPMSRVLLAIWVIFNAALGFLMGVYHQGGVVPTQLAIPSIISTNVRALDRTLEPNTKTPATVFWWKTYSPPLWLLGDNASLSLDIKTRDFMGIPGADLIQELENAVPTCPSNNQDPENPESVPETENKDSIFVVAPKSATFLDKYTASSQSEEQIPNIQLHELWTYRNHLNLDDLDFGDDGIIPTLTRVIGRRGLTVWSVKRTGCN